MVQVAQSSAARSSLVVRLRRAAQMGVFAGCVHPVGIVLVCAASSADKRGRCVVHPKVMAAELGLSVATLNRALAEAASLGFVASRRRRRVGTVVGLSMAVLGALLAMSDRASDVVRNVRHGRFLSRFAAGRAAVAARVQAILGKDRDKTLVSSCCVHGEPIQSEPEPEAEAEPVAKLPDRAAETTDQYLARILRERREGRR
jgi:hypothetical protein